MQVCSVVGLFFEFIDLGDGVIFEDISKGSDIKFSLGGLFAEGFVLELQVWRLAMEGG